jgi:hypothetical protein
MSPQAPPPLPGQGTNCCQGCGTFAPTKYITFRQNIGALFMRFRRTIQAHLCRNCINRHFASTTLITSLVGWFGMISFILTPFILISNVVSYLTSLSLKPNPGTPQTGAALAWFAVFMAVVPFVAVIALFATGALGGTHPE